MREVENDLAAREAWVLLTRDGYNPLQPIDEVVLTRGHGVSLVFTIDHDGDTVPRSLEVLYGSSDDSTDSDGDGLADHVEIQQSYDVFVVGQEPRAVLSSPGRRDTDNDGLDDKEEREREVETEAGTVTAATAANDVDTDNDGLSDLDEVGLGADPLDPDTDGDGLIDSVEVRLGSNPNAADTDGDGANDQQEVRRGTNVAIADHLITVIYNGLDIGPFPGPGIGGCEGDSTPGEFTFEFRVDIPMFSTPPEDELVMSAETVGVRFCNDDSDSGPCKTVVNGQTVIQMSGAGGSLPLASVQFPMRFEESFRLHGFVREIDLVQLFPTPLPPTPVLDLDFSFERRFIGFTLRKGASVFSTFPYAVEGRNDCQGRVGAEIRVD
jgi:hypothetical protein